MSLGREMIAGTVGGIVGALAMTAVRTVGEELGLLQEQLPHKVVRRLAAQADVDLQAHLNPTQERVLAQSEHLTLGALYGAGYGWFHQAGNRPPTVDGALYGLLIYTLTLAGIGPALQLTRAPWHEARPTVGHRLLVHLLYGLVTGFTTEELMRQMGPGKAARQQPQAPPLHTAGAFQQNEMDRAQRQRDALAWAMRMLTAQAVQGQLLRRGDYLIGYTVTTANGIGGDQSGKRQEATPDKVYLEIIVADAGDQHAIPDLNVHAKLVDQRGDEVSTHQQFLLWRSWPCHYGRICRIPCTGEYTLQVRIEQADDAPTAQRPDQPNGWPLIEPLEVEFPNIHIVNPIQNDNRSFAPRASH